MSANDETGTGLGATRSVGLSLMSSSIQKLKSPDPTRSPGLDTFKRKSTKILFNDTEEDSSTESASSGASVSPVDLTEAQATPTQSNTKIKIRISRSASATCVPRPDGTFPLRSSQVPNYNTFSMSSRRSRGSRTAPSGAGNETAGIEVATPTNSPTKRFKIPQLSTIELKPKNLYAELGYTSRDFWEVSDDEFEEINGTPVQASDTKFQSVNRDASSANTVSPIPSLRQSPRTPTDEGTQKNLVEQVQALKLLPCQKTRQSMTRKFNASLKPSVRRSLLRSVEYSPTKCTGGSSLKTLAPTPSRAVQQKMSIWDADDEEFDRWPGQET